MSEEAKRQALDDVYAGARKRFPDVPEITADELLNRLNDGELIIVDVREIREQAVSMIPGSITASHFEANAEEYHGKTIVSYCTIGGRSGMYSRQLQANGWKVLNLKGSVIAWSLAGGEFTSSDGPTNKVHTHTRKFAAVVAEGYEAVW